ncbi:MAG TPA: metallophosphoesterase [Gaiellaceae bacterium]|nr:metallophosphoesterase [Gaiellaceae bacterium]
MVTRILHVSDLHVGARDDPILEPALRTLVERVAPHLVVASGDLTHRGQPAEHERAAELLRSLDVALLAVPGNHDIPHAIPARFSRPWEEFERLWLTTEPTHESDSVVAIGLNSVRPWRHQSGGLSAEQLTRAEARLRAAPPAKLRLVALHHQLVNAPWRTRKQPLARRGAALSQLEAAGAELVVSGHVHQIAVAERHEFEVIDGDVAGSVLATAPGLGQPRPHRRGEARGALAYRVDEHTIAADSYLWRDGDWRLTAVRTFSRGRASLD